MALLNYPSLFDTIFDVTPSRGIKWDISDNDDNYIIAAEVPGCNRDQVKVSLDNGVLTISANREHDIERKGEKYYYRERSVGQIRRSIKLPVNPDPSTVAAKYVNGVLTITIPKTGSSVCKEITVEEE